MKRLVILVAAALLAGCATTKKSAEAPAEYVEAGPSSTYIVTVRTAEATKPAEAKPEATKPAEAKPEATKPAEAKPEATKPEATKPEATKPAEAKPEA